MHSDPSLPSPPSAAPHREWAHECVKRAHPAAAQRLTPVSERRSQQLCWSSAEGARSAPAAPPSARAAHGRPISTVEISTDVETDDVEPLLPPHPPLHPPRGRALAPRARSKRCARSWEALSSGWRRRRRRRRRRHRRHRRHRSRIATMALAGLWTSSASPPMCYDM